MYHANVNLTNNECPCECTKKTDYIKKERLCLESCCL